MLGVEHVLRVYGRAPVERPARPKVAGAQVLPMGAVHLVVPSVPLLHTTSGVARALDQIGPEHREPGGGGALLPVLGEVPRPRQDHALHAQVGRPVLVHAAATQRRHLEEVRLRLAAALLHRRLVLLLRRLEQHQPERLVVRRPGPDRRHLSRLFVLSRQVVVSGQLARAALLAQRFARTSKFSPLWHRDHAEYHAGSRCFRFRLLSSRHHV